jgi:shikimate 5-dehydrogenase
MTVCDVTEMPFDSAFIKQARERGAKVVEPRNVYMDRIATQVKSITGKDVAAESFEKFVNAALDD